MYFYPSESATYLSIEASEGRRPRAFYKQTEPLESSGKQGCLEEMLICCGTDKLQGMSGEWALGITMGTMEHFRGLGVDGTTVGNLDPNSITYNM